MMSAIQTFLVTLCVLIVSSFAAQAQVAAGWPFTLDKSAIAGGGLTSSGGSFEVEGTSGQAAAVVKPTGPRFAMQNGFWTAVAPLGPTAGEVKIGGRTTTADGRGIRGVFVRLVDPSCIARTAVSSDFGYYTIEDVPVGVTYILSVVSKRFVFAEPNRVLTINDEVGEINFVSLN